MEGLQQRLETLSCHFTWKELEQDGSGRTVEMNLGDLEEDNEDDECFEVQWCNLKGYYYAKQKDFEKASHFFEKALEKSITEDQKVVTLSCMAWLDWLSQRETEDNLNKVNNILQGRRSESIPEVMAEKAFAMVEGGGFTTKRFQEAKRCIDYALRKRPDNLPFMFIKAKCMQKLLVAEKKVIHPEDTEAKEVDQIWQDLRAETIKINVPTLQAQVSIYYALFLNKVHNDYGKSGQKYADEAENLCGSNPSVLRKVAQFYIKSAGNNTSKMNKAEQILQKILKEKPNRDKALSLYGQLLYKRYRHAHSPWDKEIYFLLAEEQLQKAWLATDKKYIIPALDLWLLYDARCDEPAVSTYEVILNLESLFSELMCSSIDREITLNTALYSAYALYLKKHGTGIAARMQECELYDASATQCPPVASQEESMRQVQEALRRYQENQDDELLHKADIMFRSVQQTLENQEDDVKATFHKSYADFLDKYSKDLAVYYFKTSLESKPSQIPRYTYDHLEELANEKIISNNEPEKRKGEEILQWMQTMKTQHQI